MDDYVINAETSQNSVSNTIMTGFNTDEQVKPFGKIENGEEFSKLNNIDSKSEGCEVKIPFLSEDELVHSNPDMINEHNETQNFSNEDSQYRKTYRKSGKSPAVRLGETEGTV